MPLLVYPDKAPIRDDVLVIVDFDGEINSQQVVSAHTDAVSADFFMKSTDFSDIGGIV